MALNTILRSAHARMKAARAGAPGVESPPQRTFAREPERPELVQAIVEGVVERDLDVDLGSKGGQPGEVVSPHGLYGLDVYTGVWLKPDP